MVGDNKKAKKNKKAKSKKKHSIEIMASLAFTKADKSHWSGLLQPKVSGFFVPDFVQLTTLSLQTQVEVEL